MSLLLITLELHWEMDLLNGDAPQLFQHQKEEWQILLRKHHNAQNSVNWWVYSSFDSQQEVTLLGKED